MPVGSRRLVGRLLVLLSIAATIAVASDLVAPLLLAVAVVAMAVGIALLV